MCSDELHEVEVLIRSFKKIHPLYSIDYILYNIQYTLSILYYVLYIVQIIFEKFQFIFDQMMWNILLYGMQVDVS